jgi:hypothetical protein
MRPAFRRGWGERKVEASPWRGPVGRSPPHGGGYFRFGNERAKPLVFPHNKRTEVVSLPKPQRGKRTAPLPGATQTDVLRAGLWASGSAQKWRALRSAIAAGQSASSIFPAHQTPLLIVTRMGWDYRPGPRQRIERVARRAAPITCASSPHHRTVRFRFGSSRGGC